MQVLVQKFGGTSLQNNENRKYVINHIRNALVKEYKVVVVVSALGRKPDPYATDSLLDLVEYPAIYNSERELDLLVSCGEVISSVVLSNELNKQHISSKAVTGSQAGIITNDEYTQAKIKEVNPEVILESLNEHDVVVVAGFQGQTTTNEITTLGRGGSDTTAAALGVSLGVESIEIFTDVNGIMTADPQIVKSARQLDAITYNEITNLANQGAKVIHPRAIEIAMQASIPIRVRSTYTEALGTIITSSLNHFTESDIRDQLITGVTHISNITQIIVEINNQENAQAEVFQAMTKVDISVDFINISPTNVIFTIPDKRVNQAISILKTLGFQFQITENCAKVSVVGAGMTGVPGVAAKIVTALTENHINILQSADSHTTIWVLIHDEDIDKALNVLHETFELGTNESSSL